MLHADRTWRTGQNTLVHQAPDGYSFICDICAPGLGTRGGKAVSGIVKDDTGNPLIGVTVTVPGTTKGTTTDANGTYTINADNSESLNFSYVGYKPQTIHVNNQSTIDVTMSEDNTSLEEVVVVGYGVKKRRDIVLFNSLS